MYPANSTATHERVLGSLTLPWSSIVLKTLMRRRTHTFDLDIRHTKTFIKTYEY